MLNEAAVKFGILSEKKQYKVLWEATATKLLFIKST